MILIPTLSTVNRDLGKTKARPGIPRFQRHNGASAPPPSPWNHKVAVLAGTYAP